jgi:hypothetical protein
LAKRVLPWAEEASRRNAVNSPGCAFRNETPRSGKPNQLFFHLRADIDKQETLLLEQPLAGGVLSIGT